jgi:hypothetical protein
MKAQMLVQTNRGLKIQNLSQEATAMAQEFITCIHLNCNEMARQHID